MDDRAEGSPADTRMMGVVHSALRRDLVRARLVLESEPPPDQTTNVKPKGVRQRGSGEAPERREAPH
jgi:hypothetical protein